MQNLAPSGFSVEQFWQRICTYQQNKWLASLVSLSVGKGHGAEGQRLAARATSPDDFRQDSDLREKRGLVAIPVFDGISRSVLFQARDAVQIQLAFK
jgi:hypothetical protein